MQQSEAHLLTPLRSTTASPSTECPPPGFGFEFERCLNQRWEAELKLQEARREKYEQLGLDSYDIRRSTPDHIREAYFQLVHEDLNDVHTPTPSPPPSHNLTIHSAVARSSKSTRPLRADNVQPATGRSKHKSVDGVRKSTPRARKERKNARPNGIYTLKTGQAAERDYSRGQRTRARHAQTTSTHHMMTRSKSTAINYTPPGS